MSKNDEAAISSAAVRAIGVELLGSAWRVSPLVATILAFGGIVATLVAFFELRSVAVAIVGVCAVAAAAVLAFWGIARLGTSAARLRSEQESQLAQEAAAARDAVEHDAVAPEQLESMLQLAGEDALSSWGIPARRWPGVVRGFAWLVLVTAIVVLLVFATGASGARVLVTVALIVTAFVGLGILIIVSARSAGAVARELAGARAAMIPLARSRGWSYSPLPVPADQALRDEFLAARNMRNPLASDVLTVPAEFPFTLATLRAEGAGATDGLGLAAIPVSGSLPSLWVYQHGAADSGRDGFHPFSLEAAYEQKIPLEGAPDQSLVVRVGPKTTPIDALAVLAPDVIELLSPPLSLRWLQLLTAPDAAYLVFDPPVPFGGETQLDELVALEKELARKLAGFAERAAEAAASE